MSEPAVSAAPRQTLSPWDGIAFLIGIVIGIGIFKTPQLVAQFAGTTWAFMGKEVIRIWDSYTLVEEGKEEERLQWGEQIGFFRKDIGIFFFP